MSTVHMTIENVTEEGEEWKTYSVIDNMNIYRVCVEDDVTYTAFNQDNFPLKDNDLAMTLINQVIEFEKGE